MAEPLAAVYVLGSAAAKIAFRLWTHDNKIGSAAAPELAALIDARVKSYTDARKVRRNFERLGDTVAERLTPFIEAELDGLDEGERTAATLSVADSLERARISDDTLFQADLDADYLKQHIIQLDSTRDALNNARLGEAGQTLWRRLLDESCECLVEVATALPDFQGKYAAEMLRRESEMESLLSTVLERMPPPFPDPETAEREFEVRYLRSVAKKLDRLELFGLSLRDERIKRYALSTAYISLTASTERSTGSADKHQYENSHVFQQRRGGLEATESEYVRVDSVLAASDLLLLRGDAGSGKTTLLQWVAVRCSRKEFENGLSDLNDRVPFLIHLRRYVGSPLPRPENLIDFLTPNLVGEMPRGWVNGVLASGRGLLLVDGVDELPETERPRVKQWIEELLDDYDDLAIIATSRPPAVGANWLDGLGFTSSEIQPMTMTDVRAFIRHWHDAVAEGFDQDDRDQCLTHSLRLSSLVQETPALRSLATSPLLCAMLCALNQDRRSQLPRNRLELYRLSLETLLDRRDAEREVGRGSISLSLPMKQVVLQGLAHWLARNKLSETDTETAVERVAEKMVQIPELRESDPEVVLSELLVRSGLLRSPTEGRIDFVHKTFLEYLCAREIVEEESIPFLIGHGESDHWREVVILAAGLARPRESRALLEGLVHRGDEDPDVRHRLHLLAVACMETATVLDQDVQDILVQRLASLVPPTNMTEARALASAGDLAVANLSEYSDSNVQIAAACVRALSLIGTTDALQALRVYAPDDRVTVSREVLRAWPQFDLQEFAERVLAESPLEHGRMKVSDESLLPYLPFLKKLESIELQVPPSVRSLDFVVPVADKVSGVVIGSDAEIDDLHILSACSALRGFSYSKARIADVDFLRGLPLERVALRDSAFLRNVDSLVGCPLHFLNLENSAGVDLEPLRSIESLVDIDISGTGRVRLNLFENMARLEDLSARHTQLTSLRIPSPVLTYLDLGFSPLETLSGINLVSTKTLVLEQCAALESVAELAEARNLRQLDVDGCVRVRDLAVIEGLPIVYLRARGLTVEDASFMASLSMLELLDISESRGFAVDAMYGMDRLRFLNVARCGIRDFDFLRFLPRLQFLTVGRDQYSDALRHEVEKHRRLHGGRLTLGLDDGRFVELGG